MFNVLIKKYYSLLKQLAGFSAVGVLVTLGNVGLLYLLLEVLHYNVYFSYCLVYFILIAISYYLNAKFVFKGRLSLISTFLYYMIYLGGMGLGVILLYLYGLMFPIKDFVKTLMVIPITAIWNFLLVKFLFSNGEKALAFKKIEISKIRHD